MTFPEKVVWGLATLRTAVFCVGFILELRKESPRSLCREVSFCCSEYVTFLSVTGLVSTLAYKGLPPVRLSTIYAPEGGGCYGNNVTPCFSKKLSWQMPKGTLCLCHMCVHPLRPSAGLLAVVSSAHRMPRPAASSCFHSQLAL